ncbi:hypothetical protein ACFW1F_36670 [Streptomyces bungoensis]|uniref:hypothetical protein n=1 Tax=Streptomyces bungoensis TaxID=285568 RepID=UPI0036D0D5DD
MTKIGTTGGRRALLPVVLLAALAAGCGTQRAADDTAAAGATPHGATATPSAPVDRPCPGESTTPTPQAPTPSASPTAPPQDHYAENHGFMVPFPLHGDRRCQGIEEAGRVRKALEPLRRRGDFSTDAVREALLGLGYPAERVETSRNGPTSVDFLVQADDYPVCVEGDMNRARTETDAFGGYPDQTGCDRPTGGH